MNLGPLAPSQIDQKQTASFFLHNFHIFSGGFPLENWVLGGIGSILVLFLRILLLRLLWVAI